MQVQVTNRTNYEEQFSLPHFKQGICELVKINSNIKFFLMFACQKLLTNPFVNRIT